MAKELRRISLVEVRKDEYLAKDLYTPDQELEKIQQKLELPKDMEIKEYDDLGTYDNPKKFSINPLVDTLPYFRLVELFKIDYSKTENKLGSIDEIGSSTAISEEFEPNLVCYYFEENDEENDDEFIYIVNTTLRSLLIKDKIFWFNKKKSGSEGRIEISVEEIDKGINLPISGFLCEIKKSSNLSFSVKVFNSSQLDSALRLTDRIHSCAKATLERFKNDTEGTFKLAQKTTQVEIRNSAAIMEVVKSDMKLSKSLSLFRGHQNKTINQISKEELQQAFQRLHDHLADQESVYSLAEIPEYSSEDNKITVNEHQIKIFAALLDNKIVEKILTSKIELPFY